jgi:hypothetical protein
MIVLLRSVVMIAVLGLLPAQAWSACAWVLWVEQDVNVLTVRPTGSKWLLIEASDSLNGCKTVMKKQIGEAADRIRSKHPDRTLVLGDSSITITGTVRESGSTGSAQDVTDNPFAGMFGPPVERTAILAFKCLPETIDPRGPKGSGR